VKTGDGTILGYGRIAIDTLGNAYKFGLDASAQTKAVIVKRALKPGQSVIIYKEKNVPESNGSRPYYLHPRNYTRFITGP
jgi:hypothetical protein